MVRIPCLSKSGLKKGTWTPEEDKKLIDYITKYGHWNWRLLPKFAGLARCGKSCRLRWVNYLRPNLKRGNYTQQEEETIIKLHRNLGNRWSAIAAQLPGRTDNEIKNYWNTNLKNRSQQDSESEDLSSIEPTANLFQSFHTTQDSSPISQHSSSNTSTDYTTVTSKENLALEEDDECAFWDNDTDLIMSENLLEPYMLDLSYIPYEPEYFGPVFDAELWSHDYSSSSTSTEYTTATSNENLVLEENTTVTSNEKLVLEEYTTVTSNKNLVLEDVFAFWDADTDLMSEIEPEYFSPVFDAELWNHDNSICFHTTQDSFPISQH